MYNKIKRFFNRSNDLPDNDPIVALIFVCLFPFGGTILLTAFQFGLITQNTLYDYVANSITFSLILISFLIIYFSVLRFAISETVEKLLRRIHDVRRIATLAEKERLYPIFESVYDRMKSKKIRISPNVKLYIIDTMAINAYSISLTTIAVTRGLMATMDDEELEALIAHEFGHLYRGEG